MLKVHRHHAQRIWNCEMIGTWNALFFLSSAHVRVEAVGFNCSKLVRRSPHCAAKALTEFLSRKSALANGLSPFETHQLFHFFLFFFLVSYTPHVFQRSGWRHVASLAWAAAPEKNALTTLLNFLSLRCTTEDAKERRDCRR